MKRTFEMNGNQYTSMMDIARELGVKRVYPKDFDKYGIVETTGQAADTKAEETQKTADDTVQKAETTEIKAEKQAAETKKSDKKSSKKQDTPKVEKKSEETPKAEKSEKKEQPKVDRRFTRKTGTAEEIQEVQNKVTQMTIVEFNNYIKHFSLDALVQMAEAVGVKTWEDIENEPIRKMRLLMEIKGYYFPNDKTPVKPNSCWRKVPLEKLLELADEKKLEYKTSSDSKIQRMWVILALNNAGLTPQDLKQEEKEENTNA